MEDCILARAQRLELEEGRWLRLLSALEVLQARREAEELAQGEAERALCANACLLARALEGDGGPLFDGGASVLDRLTVEEIADLSGRWRAFNRKENPSPALSEGELEEVKKN